MAQIPQAKRARRRRRGTNARHVVDQAAPVIDLGQRHHRRVTVDGSENFIGGDDAALVMEEVDELLRCT